MHFDTDRVVTGYQSGSSRQRLISMLLSAAIVICALLFALYHTTIVPEIEKSRNPVTFNVKGEQADSGAKAPEKAKKAKKAEKKEKKKEEKKEEPEKVVVKEQPKVRVPVLTPVPPVVTSKPVVEKPAFSFLKLSRAEMAAADIGGIQRAPASPPASTSSTASGSSAGGAGGGASHGPGEGPGGATLYNAEWFREPTGAQLSSYIPGTAPASGWGMVACQTIPNNRVENCQILGESPRGSGFGRAVLNAAWQFEVRPPRVNGKPQVGEWVRIRIQYGVRRES